MAHSVLSSFLYLSHYPPRVASSIACVCMGTSYWRVGRGARRFPARHVALPLQFRCCSSSAESEGAAQRRKRVVSGVQPTGLVHLGNYLGAIKNWTSLQNTYETLFFIVDLHAITLPYEAPQLSKATKETAAIYLACGVDTSKASVFVQSHVPAHVELMWLLSSVTPIGWLNRMIQFKEKSRKAVRWSWR